MFFKFYYYKFIFFCRNKLSLKVTHFYKRLWFRSNIIAKFLLLKVIHCYKGLWIRSIFIAKLFLSKKRIINILTRILLFSFFTYILYIQAKPIIDKLSTATFHPLYQYTSNSIFKISQADIISWGDYGAYFIICTVSYIGNIISQIFTGNAFIITEEICLYCFSGLILMPVFLILLPNIPLPISIGSVIALYLVITKVYTTSIILFYSTWIPAWSVVLCSIFLVTVFIIKKNFLGWTYLIGLSINIGYLHFLRQECKHLPYVMVISILGVLLLIIISYFYKNKFSNDIFKKMFFHDTLRITLFCSIFLGIIILETEAFRFAVSRATKTPYTSTKLMAHGTGHPLYVGLGLVANPYNIAYDDYMGGLNYLLFTKADVGKGGVDRNVFISPKYDILLYKEWGRIIRESPALLIRNIYAKALFVHNFLLKQEIKNPQEARLFDAGVQTSKLFTFLYIYLIFLMSGIMIMIFLFRNGKYFILFFSFLGIMAGGSAGALIVYQGYVKGVYGILIASFFVMSPGIYELSKRKCFPIIAENKHIYVTFIKLVLIISVLCILSIGSFAGYRSYKNNTIANKLVMGNPYKDIQKHEYNYSISFNRLSMEKQKIIIDKLKNSRGDNIITRKEHVKGDLDIFNPEILIFSERQAHLIAYLGEKWIKPPYETDQGFINSTIVLSRNNDNSFTWTLQPRLPVNQYTYNFIVDYEWTGKYKMYSFPVSDDFKSVQSFLVDTHYSFDFKNINISTNRFFRQ